MPRCTATDASANASALASSLSLANLLHRRCRADTVDPPSDPELVERARAEESAEDVGVEQSGNPGVATSGVRLSYPQTSRMRCFCVHCPSPPSLSASTLLITKSGAAAGEQAAVEGASEAPPGTEKLDSSGCSEAQLGVGVMEASEASEPGSLGVGCHSCRQRMATLMVSSPAGLHREGWGNMREYVLPDGSDDCHC